MPNRKLGKPTDQRVAMLRNLTTSLLWNGRIITTEARAKEVRPIAEKLITLAIAEYKNCTTVRKTVFNEKGQEVEVDAIVDMPSRLHARRRMMSYLYNVPAARNEKETKKDYKSRIKQFGSSPVVDKMFREIAPAMDGRKGGYTRIFKMGPRRGDGAEQVVLELVTYTVAAPAADKKESK